MIYSMIVIMLATTLVGSDPVEFGVGIYYSSYQLTYNAADVYSIEQVSHSKWHYSIEIEAANVIPHIGVKARGTMITYHPETEYSYEYIPISVCASFDILPFLEMEWLKLTVETGLGVYWWKNLYRDNVIELPTLGPAEERDLGFIGGATVQLRPLKNFVIEGVTRYNYIASTDTKKYGYFDKDEKIWENGVGLKLIIRKW